MALEIKNNIHDFYSNALFFLKKTSKSIVGHQKISRIFIAALRLSNDLFPTHTILITPILKSIHNYQWFCLATLVFSTIQQVKQEKRISFLSLYKICVTSSFTIKFLKSVNIFNISIPSKSSQETFPLNHTFSKVVFHFVNKNFVQLCIAIDSVAVIYLTIFSSEKGSSALSKDKIFLLINRTGKLALSILVMINYQNRIIFGCLDVTTSCFGYAKFLVINKI